MITWSRKGLILYHPISQTNLVLCFQLRIDNFTVAFFVSWPLNESEAAHFKLIMEFLCKLVGTYIRKVARFLSKQAMPASLSFKGQAT